MDTPQSFSAPLLRYAPEIPFPPYSYVTGQWPHPISDPAGHGSGQQAVPVILPSTEQWQTCTEYLYGIDLWNAGYYWEAHETWESLWHAAGETGTAADFFKGLIKLAAAGVKAREGLANGVERHLQRATQLLTLVQQALPNESAGYWGLTWEMLMHLLINLRLHQFPAEVTAKAPVVRVWPYVFKLEVPEK